MDDFNFDSAFDDTDDTDDIDGIDNSFQADEDGDFNFDYEDDAPIQNNANTGGGKISAEKAKDFKKTGLMLIGIALLLLIFVAVGLRVVKSTKNRPKNTGNVQVVQDSNQGSNVPQVQNSVPSQNVITNNGQSFVWQEVNLAGTDLGNIWVDSTFTITELKHYAAVTNGQNDKQVKSVAKGNISGLVGTYEVELPTWQALKLSVGTSFKVSYQLKEQGSYRIIGQIKY